MTATPPLWEFEAHPRVGGENASPSVSGSMILGSSPRRRGKQVKGLGHEIGDRLIPA